MRVSIQGVQLNTKPVFEFSKKQPTYYLLDNVVVEYVALIGDHVLRGERHVTYDEMQAFDKFLALVCKHIEEELKL